MDNLYSGSQEQMANDLIYSYAAGSFFRCNGRCFPHALFPSWAILRAAEGGMGTPVSGTQFLPKAIGRGPCADSWI